MFELLGLLLLELFPELLLLDLILEHLLVPLSLGGVSSCDFSACQLRVVDHIRVELAHLVIVGRGVQGTVLLGVESDGQLLL